MKKQNPKKFKKERSISSYKSPQEREIRKWEQKARRALMEDKYYEYKDAQRHISKLRRKADAYRKI